MQDSQAYNLQTEREQCQNLSPKEPGYSAWPEWLPRDTAAAENRIPNSTPRDGSGASLTGGVGEGSFSKFPWGRDRHPSVP